MSTTLMLALSLLGPYTPTVVDSQDAAQEIFRKMPLNLREPDMFGITAGAQCFMRAQLWGYDLFKNSGINANKTFIFYTHSFKKGYKRRHSERAFPWWFHVAPSIEAKDSQTNQIQDWILDPTFSDKILSPQKWASLFMDTGRQCVENVPYEEFRCEVEGASNNCPRTIIGREDCYLLKVPATIYGPDEIASYQMYPEQVEWNISDVDEALRYAPKKRFRSFWRQRLGREEVNY